MTLSLKLSESSLSLASRALRSSLVESLLAAGSALFYFPRKLGLFLVELDRTRHSIVVLSNLRARYAASCGGSFFSSSLTTNARLEYRTVHDFLRYHRNISSSCKSWKL